MIQAIIFDWVETLSKGKRTLFPYSEKILKILKKDYKLGLISLAGHGKEQRADDIKSTGIEHYFDSLIIAEEKTPEMYLQCIKELGSTPETTAIVDDEVKPRGI